MVRLVFDGVDTFLDDLRAVPDDLADRGRRIVYDAAGAALTDLRGAYPPRDPKSRSRFEPIGQAMVLITNNQGDLHPKAFITHREILAHWYEKGTKPRVTRRKGPRGSMPPAPTFVPITVTHERAMATQLIELLTRAGFTVADTGGWVGFNG